MILIGSKAIKQWFPEFPREPKDVDYAVNHRIQSSEKGVEYLYNPVLFKWGCSDILTPDEIYTLKLSHLFWDLNWEKHMWDVQFLKKQGCRVIQPLFYALYDFWPEIHGKNKRSNLKMTSEKFFDNALQCKYDHDWLHTLLNPVPTFNKVLKEGEEVEVSGGKFNWLSWEEKANLVREEVYVMAYERWPNMLYLKAYSIMLKKFIISHAPVWEALWIVENYIPLHKAKFNFIEHLNEKINERGDNIIKRSSRFVKEQIEV
jgi:hypothetical protein